MKHLSKFVLLTMLLGIFIPSFDLHAAEYFITNIQAEEVSATQLKVCWDIAEEVEDPVEGYPKVEYGPEDVGFEYSTDITNQSGNRYCCVLDSLEPDTEYIVNFHYKGSNLSEYQESLLWPGLSTLIHDQDFTTRTINPNATFTSVDKTYVMPGETIRLNGTHLGSGPSSLTDKVALLGDDDYSVFVPESGYEFPISTWTSKYIELTVPAYDSSLSVQSGKLHFTDLKLDEDNYDSNIAVTVINSEEMVDRAIESGYQGSEYRYLLNSSRYRYNSPRTVASLTQEQTQMQWVSNYLTSIGKGIDATWSLVLAYGLVYGGYSQDEIQHEIQFGPGCLQANIPQSVWSQTGDYAECMANEL